MSRYYALLSGEHPTIPHSELEGILEAEAGPGRYRVLLRLDGAAIFEAPVPASIITRRAGWVREVGRLLALTEADTEKILDALEAVVLERGRPRRALYRRYKRYSDHLDDLSIREVLRRLSDPAGGGYVLRIFVTEGAAIIGEQLAVLDTRALNERRPGRRPFFRPGPLLPGLTRAMINMARLRRGRPFLDPFCGTGGFVLEACIIGASLCACTDINSVMIRGSTVNLRHFGVAERCLVSLASATRLPLRGGIFPSIATDPPYGRSTSPGKAGYRRLVERFLAEASRLLEPGGHVVYAGPARLHPHTLAAGAGLEVLERHHMHVHGSLTREVVLARLPGRG